MRRGGGGRGMQDSHMSNVVFGWLNLLRLYSFYKILYPKRRIESYSIMGTIVVPNKILLTWDSRGQQGKEVWPRV